MTWSRWLRRHLVSQPARTLVSVFAVVIGVAVFVGVNLGTRAVIAEIEATQPSFVAQGDDPYTADAIEFFESIEAGLAPLASASLLVSGFIIYLTTSRTVGDRWTTFGTLRAVGATRRTVIGAVMAEAAVIGIVGTGFGIAVGHVIGPGLGDGMAVAFGLPVGAAGASLGTAQWAATLIGGTLVPVVAAGVPAVWAARCEPATAMRRSEDESSVSVLRGVIGLAALAAGTAAAFVVEGDAKGPATMLALLGLLAGVPLLVAPLAAVARGALLRFRPGISDIAAAQVARRRGRMSVTAGMVTGALVLVALTQTVSASQRPAFEHAVETTLGSDLELYTGGMEGVFEELSEAPEVTAATPVWRSRVDVAGQRTSRENLTVIDPESYFDVSGFVWTGRTDGEAASDALRRGGAALISTNVADATGAAIGDRISASTRPGEAVELVVAGTYYGFAYGTTDAVVVALRDGRRLVGEAHPDAVLLDGPSTGLSFERPSSDGSVLMFGGVPTEHVRQSILDQFDGIWGLIHVLSVVVGLLGLLGLANTLTMEILDRRHEFGLLRSLGLQEREVRRIVMVEGALFSIVAAACAVVAGTALGWALAGTGEGGVDQLVIDRRFAAGPAVALVVAALLIGGLFSVVPGRRAGRFSPTELLRAPD